MFEIFQYDPVVFPQGGPRRTPIIPPAARAPDHDQRYDYDTLFYGGVYLPDRQQVVFSGPKLRNFAPLLRAGRFAAEGAALARPRVRRFRRHDEVTLRVSQPVSGLELSIGGHDLTCPVAAQDHWFDGLNCLYTMSRNNRLEWIADWLQHYVTHQSVQGVVLVDNGSTDYGPDDLLDVMRATPGLARGVVLSIPSRYGPHALKTPVGLAKFLQSGMMNLVRRQWLAGARAVICCDVDEVLVSDGQGICDAAVASRLGYATVPCLWRAAPQADPKTVRHRDHTHRLDPESGTKEKYCIVPSGPLGRSTWDVHGVGGYWFNKICRPKGHVIYHCMDLNTGWRYGTPRKSEGRPTSPDPALQEVFQGDSAANSVSS